MTGHHVWGTFAVSDHVVKRAFVADVLLYDRLVVPTPTPDDMDRWEQNEWQPERLRSLLDVLYDPNPDYRLAVEVPWGPRQRQQWERRWQDEKKTARQRAQTRLEVADAVTFDDEILKRNRQAGLVDPLYVTRKFLYAEGDKRRDREFFERHPDVTVESVAAYPSFARFEEETAAEENSSDAGGPKRSAGLIGWEFFVPEDESRSDEDVLAAAADLARRETFQRKRADFHDLRRKTLAEGGGDPVFRARLEKGLKDYQEEMNKAGLGRAVRWAFWLGGTAVGAVGLRYGSHWLEGGALAFGQAPFLIDRMLPSPARGEYSKAAVMVHDARRHFGWE
jgi:hypothetical protein